MLQTDITSTSEQRLQRLEEHMARENPILLDVVKGFRQLDRVAHKLGLLDLSDTLTAHISWWPVIAVLGTFSSGKSTFINRYVGRSLQMTGNQAVDDKFSVICWGPQEEVRVLPGVALDKDPRFPFYRISQMIENVGEGEGNRLGNYLQLKTCNAAHIKGKIMIDSPGFDADAQRAATLRISEHIIDLSDLVLVFFDARHPEPGAMRQTLQHLVSDALKRSDFNKFLYILNQIDNTAREDNPEDVFAAWQRALAQHGLTAGRFYRIYDAESAAPIEDPGLRARFESKRAADMAEITGRMQQVEIERAYRITGLLEQVAKSIRDQVIPKLSAARSRWKRLVLTLDGVALALLLGAFVFGSVSLGWWDGLTFAPPWGEAVAGSAVLLWLLIAVIAAAGVSVHSLMRKLAARLVINDLRREHGDERQRDMVINGLRKNATSWWPALLSQPLGWGPLTRRRVDAIVASADRFVQALNDRFASPSGDGDTAGDAPATQASGAAPPAAAAAAAAGATEAPATEAAGEVTAKEAHAEDGPDSAAERAQGRDVEPAADGDDEDKASARQAPG